MTFLYTNQYMYIMVSFPQDFLNIHVIHVYTNNFKPLPVLENLIHLYKFFIYKSLHRYTHKF